MLLAVARVVLAQRLVEVGLQFGITRREVRQFRRQIAVTDLFERGGEFPDDLLLLGIGTRLVEDGALSREADVMHPHRALVRLADVRVEVRQVDGQRHVKASSGWTAFARERQEGIGRSVQGELIRVQRVNCRHRKWH